MQNDVADILLIGSGASGGVFAWHLSQDPGIRTVCLEQGDWADRTPGSEGATREQWERLAQQPPRRPGVNYFDNGYPYDHRDSYWEPILGHNVGGGTIHYSAGWGRLRASDFMVHSATGVGADWPIRYDDLARYWDLNDSHVGVSGVPGNPAYPNRRNPLLPPVSDSSRGSRILQVAADRLGWHHFPGDRAVITVPFKGRDPRDYREAKNRADVVHWPEAIRNGVVLKTRATVRKITINEQGLASGALYYDAEGQLHEQKARVVVIACNGIGTPRLLLNSQSRLFPDGLANISGLVGKGLMSHPSARVTAEFEYLDSTTDFGGGGLTIDEFYDTRPRGDAVGGFTTLAAGFSSAVEIALGVPPESIPTTIPPPLGRVVYGSSGAIPWGRVHHAAFQRRLRRTASALILCSELPNDTNRVELDPVLTDDFGTPAPKIVYHRDSNTVALLTYAMERGKELMEAAGATRVAAAYDVDYAGRGAAPGHYLGTARMGDDPERSVVDKWGRAHDVRNLFVIDGSVFVTSGAYLPTSTIQAIALRTADYIRNNAGEFAA